VGIGNKLNQDNIVDEIRNYQQNWLQYLNGMENNHLPNYHCSVNPMEKGIWNAQEEGYSRII